MLINDLIQSYTNWLNTVSGDNHFLAAAIFTTLVVVARFIPRYVLNLIERQLFYTVTLTDDKFNGAPNTYKALLGWHQESKWSSWSKTVQLRDTGRTEQERIITGFGKHIFFFEGVLFWMFVSKKDLDSKELQTLIIRTFVWNRDKIKRVLLEVHPVDYSLPAIYRLERKSYGTFELGELDRISNIYSTQRQFVDPEIYKRVDMAMRRMVENPEWYVSAGKLHKEAFMLYGEPGTGKTNLIRHFASKYGLSIIAPTAITDLHDIQSNIAKSKKPYIILLEDIDGYDVVRVPEYYTDNDGIERRHISHRSISSGRSQELLLSMFLNFFDGVAPLTNALIFMTTNRIELIEPAVYRPGRIDHLINITYPKYETLLNSLAWDENDPRRIYLDSLKNHEIPLSTLVTLRTCETLDEVKEIMVGRDDYFLLQKNAAEYINIDNLRFKE